MGNTPILELKEVQTYYGNSHILQGVSFDLQSGEILGLVGRNGVGKTTTIQTIMGLPSPRRGDIYFQGKKDVFVEDTLNRINKAGFFSQWQFPLPKDYGVFTINFLLTIRFWS